MALTNTKENPDFCEKSITCDAKILNNKFICAEEVLMFTRWAYF